MGRIFDTGDVHGMHDFDKLRWFNGNNPDLTKDDVMIINGDAGFLWYSNQKSPNNRMLQEWINSLKFSLFVVLGNHENYDLFESLPTIEKFGGTVRWCERTPKVYYAERGQVYTINGKIFWCFGGGFSIDKARRTEGVSWWKQELPTQAEMEFGLKTLEDYDRVDYIITHDCPSKVYHFIPKYVLIGSEAKLTPKNINLYFDRVWNEQVFGEWLCGHYHFNDIYVDEYGDKIRFLYNDIIELGVYENE
jgi:hypothetical protein